MYKVFIENVPVFITNQKDLKISTGLVLKGIKTKKIKKIISNWLSDLKLKEEIWIITNNPEKTFKKLFKTYDFIEAAGGIVHFNNKYLFIKRHGCWDIPKGKLEANETPKIGALREIEEECNIQHLSIDHPIIVTYHTYSYNGKPSLKKTYWFACQYNGRKKPQLIPQLEESITEVKWFKKNELDEIRTNTFASIQDVLNAYFD